MNFKITRFFTREKFFVPFLLFFSYAAFAQSWQWSKKINYPITNYAFGRSKGLLSDKNGNIFLYGTNNPTYWNSPLTDTVGSVFQCYSQNGALLFEKHWKIPFYIRKMEYDGNDHFYFAGHFFGTQTINGITITSHGNDDAVIGKIDLNGNIVWMKTFGGSGNDGVYGICFNPGDNSILVTGRIQDTLFFNNMFHSINPQSAIICRYTFMGQLLSHKLYDFSVQKHLNMNCGLEICTIPSGGFFTLTDRGGERWWGNDPGTGAFVGRYLIRLNSNLDTLWSKRINGPQSYYGMECNNLRVAANGDVYLTNWSSYKYGGEGYLMRFDGNTGNEKWSLHNNDGMYTGVYIDSNTVYLVGNEGANGCPCEYHTPGYYVIKKIDENNVTLGETRISRVYLADILKDDNGNIFLTGAFGDKQGIIGPDTIPADSLLIYSASYTYYGKFLSKLGDVNCLSPNLLQRLNYPVS